mmetsp:Transcript_10043/g.29724  ORF Transcript_10043/g.29724 Transcript_10043/m.29724 type:complete len:313 (+) Transcript_10043:2517-3455(+)
MHHLLEALLVVVGVEEDVRLERTRHDPRFLRAVGEGTAGVHPLRVDGLKLTEQRREQRALAGAYRAVHQRQLAPVSTYSNRIQREHGPLVGRDERLFRRGASLVAVTRGGFVAFLLLHSARRRRGHWRCCITAFLLLARPVEARAVDVDELFAVAHLVRRDLRRREGVHLWQVQETLHAFQRHEGLRQLLEDHGQLLRRVAQHVDECDDAESVRDGHVSLLAVDVDGERDERGEARHASGEHHVDGLHALGQLDTLMLRAAQLHDLLREGRLPRIDLHRGHGLQHLGHLMHTLVRRHRRLLSPPAHFFFRGA